MILPTASRSSKQFLSFRFPHKTLKKFYPALYVPHVLPTSGISFTFFITHLQSWHSHYKNLDAVRE
jgi:hypothetical protein